VPSFRHRLTRAQQRTYDRSDAVTSVPLRADARLYAIVEALPAALGSGDPAGVQQVAQALCNELTRLLRVPPLRVLVSGTRPSNPRGELHGLYTPRAGGAGTIKVWMITAKRGQIVAFKTFLRTLLHEVCHHLDYALLGLDESFHTDGFYKRESSLFYRVGGPAAAAQAAPAGRTTPESAGTRSRPRPA
jgi:hypothetical protein